MTNHFSSTRRAFLGSVAGGVFSITASGRILADDEPSGKPAFSFGAITDAQYADQPAGGTRFYLNSRKKLSECVEAFNRMELAFVIHLGDFIDRDFASFDTVLPIYNRLSAPHYCALGNHDFSVADELKAKVTGKLGMKSNYYSFVVRDWRFLVLDGNDVGVLANLPGSAKHKQAEAMLAKLKAAKVPNAQSWNGAIGEKQMQWLRDELAKAEKAAQRTVVFCHFPVYPKNVHNLWNDAEVVQVLESSASTVAYINGHNHAGNYGVRKGIHYLTLKGMVETADTTAYATVDPSTRSLNVDGVEREPDRTLTVRP